MELVVMASLSTNTENLSLLNTLSPVNKYIFTLSKIGVINTVFQVLIWIPVGR